MSFKGKITAVLRNASTLEVEASQEVSNIITESFFDKIIATGTITDLKLVINGKKMASSRWTTSFPTTASGNFSFTPDLNITSVPSVQFFPKTQTSPAFLQFSGRYNPPATDRTIRTILLAEARPGSNGWGYNIVYLPDDNQAMAYASLNSDCIQTSSQVLDMYYRIFFPEDPDSLTNFTGLSDLISSFGLSLSARSIYPTPLVSVLKPGDEDKILVSSIAHRWNNTGTIRLDCAASDIGTLKSTSLLNWNSSFADTPGTIYSGFISGGQYAGHRYKDSYNDYYLLKATDYYIETPVVLEINNLISTKKVQNLIGHGSSNKPPTTTPWLDVDNLPNGAGRIILNETWNNRNTPTSPELYSKTLLPKWNKITIKDSGGIGSGGSYNYTTCNFFGHSRVDLSDTYGRSSYLTSSAYTFHSLPSLCGSAAVINPTIGSWKWLALDAGKTLIEDITKTYLDTEQISACTKYDETSFVIVKKNFIMLYSVGGGDYWKFKGPFTNIHQVAVVGDIIYIACRNTGLYKVNPKLSLEVTSLSSPSAGVDLAKCYGVAKGYNNSLWAIGENGLFSLINGVWDKYSENTTPAFLLAGVSDNNWSNIAYLKVDEYSPAYQMHLVRKLDATIDANYFGIWWSLSTPAQNSFQDITILSMGRPRVNRTHFGGQDGLWAIANEAKHKVMSFNATAPKAVISGAAIDNGKLNDIYTSIFFAYNKAGQIRLMSMHESSYLNGNGNWRLTSKKISMVTPDGIIEESGDTALLFAKGNSVPYDFSGFGTRDSTTRFVDGGYGYSDSAATIILDKGVMVSLWCGTEYGTSYVDGGNSTMDNFIVGISNYGTGFTIDGGPLAYLAENSYGWNGTEWVNGLNTPKPLHSDFQNLLEGVTVKFENAASGASFVSSNYYKFGLCEGILKDNATRHNLNIRYTPRKKIKSSNELSSYLVPSLTQLQTGVVGLNAQRSAEGSYVDSLGRFIFPIEAGYQIGYCDKQVTGNFKVNYDSQYLKSIVEARTWCTFGVARMTDGPSVVGFHLSAGILYIFDGVSYVAITSDFTNLDTLSIQRVGDSINLLRNNVLLRTVLPVTSKILTCNSRLELVALANSGAAVPLSIPNRQCPSASIETNGSDRAVFIGSEINKTGYYGDRFFGIDSFSANNIVKLNGVSATIKYDGTVPLAGEVSIDAASGILYFNAADENKVISSTIDYYKSE